MTEMANGLIEMNAHMVRTGEATTMIVMGLFGALLMLFAAVLAYPAFGWKATAILGIIGLAFAVVFIMGMNEPRVKELRMCAYGPVSLEAVAGQYQIVKVDGKEITVREK
jgi:hypothetical protein